MATSTSTVTSLATGGACAGAEQHPSENAEQGDDQYRKMSAAESASGGGRRSNRSLPRTPPAPYAKLKMPDVLYAGTSRPPERRRFQTQARQDVADQLLHDSAPMYAVISGTSTFTKLVRHVVDNRIGVDARRAYPVRNGTNFRPGSPSAHSSANASGCFSDDMSPSSSRRKTVVEEVGDG
jgi:hypothetical protein